MNPQSEYGLLVPGMAGRPCTVALTGVRVDATVKGSCSRVTVVQDYENREDVPLEAVYVFPLEEGSAVCGFSVTIGERLIAGQVLPRDEAFDRYDDAMAEGHGAFLLDQERPNIFTASVGNILPGQKVKVEISYVAELNREGDRIRLMIPTTVSPRYVPETHRDFEGMTDGDRVNPPASIDGVPYSLQLKVEADLLSPIRTVESPSHKIRTDVDGTTAVITLAGDEGALDRDLVILLGAAEPHVPTTRYTRDERGDRFIQASFVPQIPTARQPVEVVFLVDCSRSMVGRSTNEARRTLKLCLQSLAEGDKFNIVCFGSIHKTLFRESVPYDNGSLEQGRKCAEAMDAHLGGTEIMKPLREILEERPDGGLPRRVVLITDGQVSNEDAVIELARKHRSTTRIFAFGIGAGSSEFLVRGVARASQGAAEFVYPGERIEDKVLRHFDRITMATATDLSMKWEGLEVEQVTPSEPTTLAPGEAVTFIGKLTGGTEGKVVLAYNVDGKETRLESVLEETAPVAQESDSVLPMIWARRKIRELEEGGEWSARRGSQQVERTHAKVEHKLVRLGTRYGLMSSATSYVAIEQRSAEDQTKERAELRRIPIALTQGWGGLRPAMRIGAAGGEESSGFKIGLSMARGVTMDEMAAPSDREEARAFLHSKIKSFGMSRSTERPAPTDELDRVLFLQRADGSWSLTQDLADLCGTELKHLKKAAKISGRGDAEQLLATLLVLLSLDSREEEASLRPVIRKAREWVDRAMAHSQPPSGYSDWLAWARQFSVKDGG